MTLPELLKVLREFDVLEYESGDVRINFAPKPPAYSEALLKMQRPLTDEEMLDDPFQGLPE